MDVLTSLLAVCLMVWAIDKARHMSRETCHVIRVGVVLIGASALATALAPLYGPPPSWLLPAALAGLCAFLMADRRIR